jgi:hypothetical protein
MSTYFTQRAVRRWLILGAVALIVRVIAFLPFLPSPWVVGSILGSWALALGATIGLSVLLGRHLRAQGRLRKWEMTGLGIMLLALILTNPLIATRAVPPGWVLTLGWVVCTIALVAGILGVMALRDRQRVENEED